MTFEGTRRSGAYEFRLARKHQGHKYYKGASGAPIADEEGRIVALVLRGDPVRNLIIGAPIARYEGLLPLAGRR
jgi:hypothetical protein